MFPKLEDYSVLAVDGSQIYPDRNMPGSSCFLINIGGYAFLPLVFLFIGLSFMFKKYKYTFIVIAYVFIGMQIMCFILMILIKNNI